MRDATQAWRRLALLALLKRTPQQTAGELAEAIYVACLAEQTPESFWRGMDPSTVFGILRQLETQGLVRKAASKRDGRAGRDSPAWELVDPDSVLADIPPAAQGMGEVVPRGNEALPHISDEQAQDGLDELAGIVARHRDQLSGLIARHHREIDDFVARLSTAIGAANG